MYTYRHNGRERWRSEIVPRAEGPRHDYTRGTTPPVPCFWPTAQYDGRPDGSDTPETGVRDRTANNRGPTCWEDDHERVAGYGRPRSTAGRKRTTGYGRHGNHRRTSGTDGYLHRSARPYTANTSTPDEPPLTGRARTTGVSERNSFIRSNPSNQPSTMTGSPGLQVLISLPTTTGPESPRWQSTLPSPTPDDPRHKDNDGTEADFEGFHLWTPGSGQTTDVRGTRLDRSYPPERPLPTTHWTGNLSSPDRRKARGPPSDRPSDFGPSGKRGQVSRPGTSPLVGVAVTSSPSTTRLDL